MNLTVISVSLVRVMRSRYYDPYSQKFLSEDPIGFGGQDTNLYRYVWNNPLLLKDPYGEMGWGAIIGIGIGIGIWLDPEEISRKNYDDYKQTDRGDKFWEDYKRKKEIEKLLTPKDPSPDPLEDLLKKGLPKECGSLS